MKRVLVSGHFDPFHDGHLCYIKQGMEPGDFIICVISSDAQLRMKKGRVNIPQEGRQEILHLILAGLGVPHLTPINIWDTADASVAQALRQLKPDIFFRGPDKSDADFPENEREACHEHEIEVAYATMVHDTHGSRMVWSR